MREINWLSYNCNFLFCVPTSKSFLKLLVGICTFPPMARALATQHSPKGCSPLPLSNTAGSFGWNLGCLNGGPLREASLCFKFCQINSEDFGNFSCLWLRSLGMKKGNYFVKCLADKRQHSFINLWISSFLKSCKALCCFFARKYRNVIISPATNVGIINIKNVPMLFPWFSTHNNCSFQCWVTVLSFKNTFKMPIKPEIFDNNNIHIS